MKQLKITIFLCLVLFCAAFVFEGCQRMSYCTYATRSNRCDIDRNANLCFKCNGNSCPDLVNKQVYLKKGANDSCLVSLGAKISDCGKCAEGDSIVVLSSIVPE